MNLNFLSRTLILLGLASSITIYASSAKTQSTGKDLIKANNCMVCHTLEGKGGCLAPPFDGIAKRRSSDFLMARITLDKAEEEKFFNKYQAQELMPHVRIPKPQAKKVVEYLLSTKEPEKGFKVVGHDKHSPKEKEMLSKLIVRLEYKDDEKVAAKPQSKDNPGKKLFYEKGCLACHSLDNVGGRFAPNLDHIGKRKSLKEIAKKILAAELRPNIDSKETAFKADRMPSSNLNLDEVLSIANYLKSLK